MKNFRKFLEDIDLSKNDLNKIITYSKKIQDVIPKNSELEDWIKAKLTHAEDYVNTVLDYVKFYKLEEHNKMAIGDLKSIHSKAREILELIDKTIDLKDWVKAKLNLAGEYLDDVYHHLDYRSTK
jgi:hypothetical protein